MSTKTILKGSKAIMIGCAKQHKKWINK